MPASPLTPDGPHSPSVFTSAVTVNSPVAGFHV